MALVNLDVSESARGQRHISLHKGPLQLSSILDAFHSTGGLTLRIADPSERESSSAVSTSVWRSDLPVSLFADEEDAGIIYVPGSTNVLCAYIEDANTQFRYDGTYSEHDTKDKCGHLFWGPLPPKYLGSESQWNKTGQCEFSSPADFVTAYIGEPKSNVCHFNGVPEMLEAQKAFLKKSIQVWTPPLPIIGLRDNQGIMTLYNEVIIAPSKASSVGGIFWAHEGSFREPQASDEGAMKIAKFLSAGTDTLPVFELANVHGYSPADDWFMTQQQKLEDSKDTAKALDGADLGPDVSSVFRELNSTVFINLLKSATI